MSKYIIEIQPEYEDKFRGVMILGAENSNLYVDSQTVDELEELNSDYINEHFGDLQDTAYQKGLEEGREQMPCDTCAYRHNNLLCADCKWTYGSRYKVDSIGVGDVVETKNGTIFAVTKITADGLVVGFAGNGSTCGFAHSEVTKTGRHFDIAKILEAMKA